MGYGRHYGGAQPFNTQPGSYQMARPKF
jgi:hypothetical protein